MAAKGKIKRVKKGVSVVIPNFNGEELVLKNLPGVIKAWENKDNKIIEVIIVDDGSKDESCRVITENFPQIKLIKHKVNRGFSAAVNTGARASRGEFLCLINNDVTPDGNFLAGPLALFTQRRNLFGVSFYEKGWGWAKGEFVDGFIVHSPGHEGTKPHPTFFVNAGGALYKRDLWMKIGGMDEAVFSPFYWEDVDISYRALKRGYQLLWDPRAIVSPNVSATIGKMPKKKVSRIQERNHLLFVWKNLTSSALTKRHVFELFKRMLKHPGYTRIFVMALLRLRAVLRSRKKEKKESRISDEAILARY